MFKQTHDFNTRYNECLHIMQTYPKRIPIILEHQANRKKKYKDIKVKYVVSNQLTIRQFLYIIKTKLDIEEDDELKCIIDNILVKAEDNVQDVYQKNKDKDGYVYIKYWVTSNTKRT